MAVSKRTRFEVLRRDNHTCRYCGASAPDVPLRVDHVIPVALGGSDAPDNLVAACQDCNSGKTSTSPDAQLVADVSSDALRWAAAMRQVAADAVAEVGRDRQLVEDFEGLWATLSGSWRPDPLPADYEASLTRWISAGLPYPLIERAARRAFSQYGVTPGDRFRYMAGVCWKQLTELQEAAREVVTSASPQPVADDPWDPNSPYNQGVDAGCRIQHALEYEARLLEDHIDGRRTGRVREMSWPAEVDA